MKYAYVFYNSIIFRFKPDRMTFRDLDEYDETRRNTYTELNRFTKNGLDINKSNTKDTSWEEYVAITAWSCFIIESKNTVRFREFYKLFERENDDSDYIFFYTEHFIFRMSKGLIEAYDVENRKWSKVAMYELANDFNFKSLSGFMITHYCNFMKDVNSELMNFINYEKTSPRFLEFLKVIENGRSEC